MNNRLATVCGLTFAAGLTAPFTASAEELTAMCDDGVSTVTLHSQHDSEDIAVFSIKWPTHPYAFLTPGTLDASGVQEFNLIVPSDSNLEEKQYAVILDEGVTSAQINLPAYDEDNNQIVSSPVMCPIPGR